MLAGRRRNRVCATPPSPKPILNLAAPDNVAASQAIDLAVSLEDAARKTHITTPREVAHGDLHDFRLVTIDQNVVYS